MPSGSITDILSIALSIARKLVQVGNFRSDGSYRRAHTEGVGGVIGSRGANLINVDRGYVHRPDQVEWIAGARETVRHLNDLGYRVVVVTNQAGVAHGYYGEESVHLLHAWMQEQLAG